jgi:hypothetical protein
LANAELRTSWELLNKLFAVFRSRSLNVLLGIMAYGGLRLGFG